MHNNLLLWREDAGQFAATEAHAAIASHSVARSWLDPSAFNDIVGVDFGAGKMHYYMCNAGRKLSVTTEAALATLLSLPRNTLIICESAHLAVPQAAMSLSQPFTAEQLLRFYDQAKSRDLTIKLFPHSHSGKRARQWVAFHMPNAVESDKTSDINDAIALALFVKNCNDVSLANPPQSFRRSPRRDYGRAVVDLSNIVLNAERTREYTGQIFPFVLHVARETRRKCGEKAIDRKAAISIASTVVHQLGGRSVMFVRDGRAPGAWMWLRCVARFSPFHYRGGIVRSNLMWHRFRSFFRWYASKRGVSVRVGNKYVKYGHFDARQKAMHAAAMRAFRLAVIKAYRIAVQVAIESGCEQMSPHDVLSEVKRGR